MTGEELDRRMREILLAATRDLSASAALVELGFSARSSFELVIKAIEAKEKK